MRETLKEVYLFIPVQIQKLQTGSQILQLILLELLGQKQRCNKGE